MDFRSNYIQSAIKQFEYYKSLGERTFDQLSDHQIFYRPDEETNSIAIIVGHLSGNMKSRWTDFLSTDGEKEWRNRDLEFEPFIRDRVDLLNQWESGWNVLFEALLGIDDTNFDQEIFIRNQAHSIVDAINRQLCHYAYHIGQIVFIGKSLKSTQWKSLSIPKGQSSEFNRQKFSKGKHSGHFTDDIK